jgi:DNA polymerase-4
LYQSQPWRGRAVRLIGVGLSGWQQQYAAQPDLFADQPVTGPQPERAVDRTIDRVREKFGPGALQRGLRRRPPK